MFEFSINCSFNLNGKHIYEYWCHVLAINNTHRRLNWVEFMKVGSAVIHQPGALYIILSRTTGDFDRLKHASRWHYSIEEVNYGMGE